VPRYEDTEVHSFHLLTLQACHRHVLQLLIAMLDADSTHLKLVDSQGFAIDKGMRLRTMSQHYVPL
jgi:hypothetical protein